MENQNEMLEVISQIEELQKQLDMLIDTNYKEETMNIEMYRNQLKNVRFFRNRIVEDIKNK